MKKQWRALARSFCSPVLGFRLLLPLWCCAIGLLFCFTTPASALDITLAWDANTEPDLAGYKVYYSAGSSGPPYNATGAAEGDSPIDVGDVTEFTLSGLGDEVTYFFAVTAYDTEGLESDYSNEVASLVAITWPQEGFYVNGSNDIAYTISGLAESADVSAEIFAGDDLLATTTARDDSTWSIEADFTDFSEGEVILTAVASGIISNAVTGTYDKTAPTSEPTAVDQTSGIIEIDWAASDETSGVASTELWYKRPGGTWSNTGLAAQTGTSGTFSYTPSEGEGTYYLATRSTDNAGNVQEEPFGCGDCTMILDTTSSTSSSRSVGSAGEDGGSGCFIGTAYFD